MVREQEPQTQGTWQSVLAYFGLVQDQEDKRIAANPAAQRIEKSRQRVQACVVVCLAVIPIGGWLLPDTVSTTVIEFAALALGVALGRRSVVLRRHALRAAGAPARRA